MKGDGRTTLYLWSLLKSPHKASLAPYLWIPKQRGFLSYLSARVGEVPKRHTGTCSPLSPPHGRGETIGKAKVRKLCFKMKSD